MYKRLLHNDTVGYIIPPPLETPTRKYRPPDVHSGPSQQRYATR